MKLNLAGNPYLLLWKELKMNDDSELIQELSTVLASTSQKLNKAIQLLEWLINFSNDRTIIGMTQKTLEEIKNVGS